MKGRLKKPWSVFRKMEAKALSFEQLSDVFGFRVITETVEDCYNALCTIHTTWPMVPGRFKDYISTPKQNDYRSIHTTIVGPSRQRVELQIRTREMHHIAEYGVAAHSLYKDGVSSPGATSHAISKETNAYAWLAPDHRGAFRRRQIRKSSWKTRKLELFRDQVFCFTPKGRLIALPRGATPIDFAYAVHTDVGDSCVGAKVNGRMMPLMTELKNGDEVEIIRSKTQVCRRPPGNRSSSPARPARPSGARPRSPSASSIQAWERASWSGRSNAPAGSLPRIRSSPCWHRLARKDVEDVLSAVGRGELSSLDVMKAVFPDHKDQRVNAGRQPTRGGLVQPAQRGRHAVPAARPVPRTRQPPQKSAKGPVPIRGVSGDLPGRLSHRRARCRATVSSAFFSRGPASPSSRSSRRRSPPSTTSPNAGSTCDGTSTKTTRNAFRPASR